MAFSEDFLYRLKQSNPIDTLFSSYVNLVKRGRDYVCLCPFHNEKTPSCHVYTDDPHFHCFGCGAGGDIITFIMKAENLEYIEAIRFLAQRAGLEVPDDRIDRREAQLRTRVLEINREAANYYFRCLAGREGTAGREYFAKRALTAQTVKKYGLGFAPESWDSLRQHLNSLGYSDDELLASGVCRRSDKGYIYDFFRNRVIFPIVDVRGSVIAFGGRILGEGQPKYLNSSDTPVFRKSRNLFSLNFAKSAGSNALILAEGYMDVIAMNQAGFENVVATLGTALTTEQALIIRRYASEVIISYDSDEAGQNATARAMRILSGAGLNVRVLKMDNAKDPDEYIKEFGAQRFKLLVTNSEDAVAYRLQKCKQGLDLQTDAGRVECLKRMTEVLAELRNPVERDVYVGRVAKEMEVNVSALNEQLAVMDKKHRYAERRKERANILSTINPDDRMNPEAHTKLKEARAEEMLISYALCNSEKAAKIRDALAPHGFVTRLNSRLFDVICSVTGQCEDFSISMLNSELSVDEMGRIIEIYDRYRAVAVSKTAAEECIKTLMEYHSFQSFGKASEMSDDELLRLQEFYKNNKR